MAEEEIYEIQLKKPYKDVVSLYCRLMNDLISGNPNPIKNYLSELCKIEFSLHSIIYKDVLAKSSQLLKSLDSIRFFYSDTSELESSIEKAKHTKQNAERCFDVEGRSEEGISFMREAKENLFEMYLKFKTKERSLLRSAQKKWGGICFLGYTGGMTLYFQILNFNKITPDFLLGQVIPLFLGFLLLVIFLTVMFPVED